MNADIFDTRTCALGEGPLWHPERNQLFWFDILGNRLLSKGQEWQFGENVSAAGWVDRDRLLIASETRLFRFDLETGTSETITSLEADTPQTRSNDGRADPWGGFWIGTMSKDHEPGAGAIYRWFGGEMRRLYAPLTIPNGICFCPNRQFAYFTDTATRQVQRHPLDPVTGWPVGPAEVFLDLNRDNLNPDGAVVDQKGTMWMAQWGAARVAAYGPDGTFQRAIAVDAHQSSCPAFGGPDLTTLFCTSAATGLSDAVLADQPGNGMTFTALNVAQGQAEHRVRL